MVMWHMCFINSSQYVMHSHANKQQVKSKNWSLPKCYLLVSEDLKKM